MYHKIFVIFPLCFILISGQCRNTENHTSVITAEEIQSEITIEENTDELSSEPETGTENEEQIIIGGHAFPANIQSIGPFGLWRFTNLEGIEKLTNLKQLVISLTEEPSNDMSALGKLNSLVNLSITSKGGIFRIADMIGAAQLKSLVLFNYEIVDLAGIENFPELETLQISAASIKNISAISALDKLTDLTISDRSKEFRVRDIIGTSNLQSLNMDMEIVDLEGIEKCTKLERIELHSTNLINYENLQELQTLKHLNFPVYNENMDLRFLQKIQSLENLWLTASYPNTGTGLRNEYYELDAAALLCLLKNVRTIYFIDLSIKNFNALSELSKLKAIYIGDETDNIDYSLFRDDVFIMNYNDR